MIEALRIPAGTFEAVFNNDGSYAGTIEQIHLAGRWYAKRRGEQYAVGCDCRACAICYVLGLDE